MQNLESVAQKMAVLWVLFYFLYFLYFCILFGLFIGTSMQNLESVAQKMSEFYMLNLVFGAVRRGAAPPPALLWPTYI